MKINKDVNVITSVEAKDNQLEVITADGNVRNYPLDAWEMLLHKMQNCEEL